MNSTLTPLHLSHSLGRDVVDIAITMGCLEVFFIVLFFVSRFKMRTVNTIDVYLLIPAFLFSFALVIICFIGVHSAGVGRHWVELSIPYQMRNLKFQTGLQFLYPGAVTFPKLSIVCLYLRIFTKKRYQYAAYAICAILVINLIILWCFDFAMCVPFRYQWNKLIHGHCIDQNALFTWISIPNLVTDVAILALPLPVIYQLKCTRGQKVGVTITVLTGSFGIITAIVRFVIFLTVPLAKDLSYYGARVTIWTTVEPGVYLIAACLPSLRPLLNYFNVPVESVRSRCRSTKKGSSKGNSADIVLSPRLDSISGHRPVFPRPEDSPPAVSYEGEIDQRGLVSCYRSTTSIDDGEVASSHGGDVGSAHGGDAASGQAVDQAVGEHDNGNDTR